MTYRIFVCSLAFAPLFALTAAADCFDRTLAIARYHYVNPGNIADNWQEIYEIALDDGAAIRATRLSRGSIASPRYDSSAPVYAPDGSRIAFVEFDSGGENPRLRVMDAADADNDLQGDNGVVLDAQDVEFTAVDWGANNLLVYGKVDGNGDTQVASATLTGNTLGPVTLHTADLDYPDRFSFVGARGVIYDVDGRYLKHLDLDSGAVTVLSGANPPDRAPTGRAVGEAVYFARIVGNTLDLWQGTLQAGPVLAASAALVTSTDYVETAPVVSADGACLAYLASDLSITYGPNSDLWIRDLATGETKQITFSRDLATAAWKP